MQLKVQLHQHLNHLPTTRWVNHTLYDLRVTHLCNQSPHLGPIYTYNKLPGNAYANQNGVPSLATFNPYDMASYGGGKVIKYHHQPKNITLKIMLASSFCPRSDHQLRWHPDRHLTRNHIPCPQTHLVDGQQQKFNMHLWSCTSSKMSLYMLRAEAKTNF